MNDVPPVRISEAFADPAPLPDAVTMVELITKAKNGTSFDAREYEWLFILLEELWYSQEFRLRMRLYFLEAELSLRNEQTKKA
jgi:hypothetical protein